MRLSQQARATGRRAKTRDRRCQGSGRSLTILIPLNHPPVPCRPFSQLCSSGPRPSCFVRRSKGPNHCRSQQFPIPVDSSLSTPCCPKNPAQPSHDLSWMVNASFSLSFPPPSPQHSDAAKRDCAPPSSPSRSASLDAPFWVRTCDFRDNR